MRKVPADVTAESLLVMSILPSPQRMRQKKIAFRVSKTLVKLIVCWAPQHA